MNKANIVTLLLELMVARRTPVLGRVVPQLIAADAMVLFADRIAEQAMQQVS